MRTRFLDAYNAVNLLRNGGLDLDSESGGSPPFWEILNAAQGAVPPDNSYSIVRGQTPDSEQGAANYIQLILTSDKEVEIRYDFRARYQSQTAGKAIPPWFRDCNLLPKGGFKVVESHLVRGADVTVAFSARVAAGKARISAYFDFRPDDSTTRIIYPSLASRDWVRPALVESIDKKRLGTLVIKIKRDELGSVEVHLGDFSLARGGYSYLPYTGDHFADAFPKGAIIMAVGKYCPPGFEKLSFTAPPLFGRIFPKNSDGSFEVEGEEEHTHEGAVMTMNPETDWPVQELIPKPPTATYGKQADDASVAHTHSIDGSPHVPSSKDVILCKRL